MNSPSEQIEIWKEDEWFVITHQPSGITTQGRSRIHALIMLSDALNGLNKEYTQAEMLGLAEEVYVPDDDLPEWIEEVPRDDY